MNLRKTLAACAVLVSLHGCGGGSGGSNPIVSVSQDLTLDPSGRTTVVTFTGDVSLSLTPGFFEASGGQVATDVLLAGTTATVEWDERVSPTHDVRVVGFGGIPDDFVDVTTTDPSAPTFAITDSVQGPGLGGDALTVVFSGPHVVPEQVLLLASWELVVADVSLDLTGTLLDFDEPSQTLEIALGPLANLWSAFELGASDLHSVADVPLAGGSVAGTADDDLDPPSLVSAAQNLEEDALGRVVDFTFDEDMDPVFAVLLPNFDVGFPVLATSVTQPAPEVLRVAFTAPVVPGELSVFLDDMFDVHGNEAASGSTPVTQGAFSIANAYTQDPTLEAVPDAGGDRVIVTTDLALWPEQATLPVSWSLEVDSTVVDMADQALDYELGTRTLTIELTGDWAFGADFTLTPNGPLQVDGDPFVTPFTGTVSGDDAPPEVVSVVQNRGVDPTGETLDVTFSEDVDAAVAESPGTWSVSGGLAVLSAELQGNGQIVRLALSGLAVPGDVTAGVGAVEDLAGNAMAGVAGLPVTSTDLLAPEASGALASGLEGAENDMVRVIFDDDMLEDEVEDPANWLIESPIGMPLDTANASISYREASKSGTLTFDGGDGISFQVDDTFQVRLVNMRDIGGNVVDGTALTGDATVELSYPELESVWVQDALPGFENRVHVRFSEPMSQLDDLSGLTRFELFDGAVELGAPTSVELDADLRGAVLVFGFALTAGVQTLDVHGVCDLAGNAMFSAVDLAVASEDPATPEVDAPASGMLTVSGERNDVVTVVFDRAMSRFGLTDPAHWAVEAVGEDVDLSRATFVFDGDRTVSIGLDLEGATALETGLDYDVSVAGVLGAQGVAVAGGYEATLTAAGDSTPPSIEVARVRLDPADPESSLLLELDEAIDPEDAQDPALLGIGAVQPDLVEPLGYRTVRATWSGGIALGQVTDVDYRDLAGNLGSLSQAITAADSAGPLLAAVAGVIAPGYGGDEVRVTFNEPIELATGLSAASYTITQSGGVAVDLAGAAFAYDSGSRTVTIELPAGTELEAALGLEASVAGVRDYSGNDMTPGVLPGSVTGDDVAPGIAAAFVNFRADSTGRTVDVRFTEDVDPTQPQQTFYWTGSGGQLANQVKLVTDDIYRVRFTSALLAGQTVSMASGLTDTAGNSTVAPLVIAPAQ